MTKSFAIFETAIGPCGIAWGERGIAAVQLPEASEQKTRARLQRRFPEACEAPPSPEVRHAIDGITALLRGEASDFSAVALDMEDLPAFNRRVYEVARAIPPGATLSYGEIAAQARRAAAGGARRRASARPKSDPDHRAVPSGAGGERQARRLLRQRRRHDETTPAHDRTRQDIRRTLAVRRSAARGAATAAAIDVPRRKRKRRQVRRLGGVIWLRG